jgi:hypothetical protein
MNQARSARPIWLQPYGKDAMTKEEIMSDPTESPQRSPLSSSSSAPSGTQAYSVTVEPDQEETMDKQATEADPSAAASAEADAQPVMDEENQPSVEDVGTDTADLPQSFSDGGSHDDADQPPAAEPFDASQAVVAEAEAEAAQSNTDGLAQFDVGDEQGSDTPSETPETTVGEEAASAAILDQMSHNFKAAMNNASNDAARISLKLMEFAQANLQNNVKLAQDYASVRTVPEIFNVHARYFQNQMELLNRQADELRLLTTDIASKKAAQIQNRFKAG